jgi:glutamine amidotransferase
MVKPRRVVIVDYGMGNLRSVANALESLGAQVAISSSAEDFAAADALVLPGVGAFAAGMTNLQDRGIVEPLRREVMDRKKPLLGICLGMQLLARTGYEHGEHAGLGWVDGTVERLFPEAEEGAPRLPHMGWNSVQRPRPSAAFEGLSEEPLFYFVHSYGFVPASPDVVTSRCTYGREFVASLEQANITAVQFHPEKSQPDGLRLLANFLEGE